MHGDVITPSSLPGSQPSSQPSSQPIPICERAFTVKSIGVGVGVSLLIAWVNNFNTNYLLAPNLIGNQLPTGPVGRVRQAGWSRRRRFLSGLSILSAGAPMGRKPPIPAGTLLYGDPFPRLDERRGG